MRTAQRLGYGEPTVQVSYFYQRPPAEMTETDSSSSAFGIQLRCHLLQELFPNHPSQVLL